MSGCADCGLRGVARDRDPYSIIDRILQLLFTSDVALRCLDGGMSEQKPNLFEFTAAIMAEPGTRATKIVGRQLGDAGLLGAPLDRIPDYVRCHTEAL